MTALPEVATNPTVGVTIFVFGGLAGAVFYLPLKRVRQWAWESYWMLWAVFALVIVPLILAFATSPNWLSVLRQAPSREILYCYLCGAAWGLGGLTWGLMIRYLGVGLGLALGCGLCSAAGTVVPPMLKGQFIELFHTPSGRASLAAAAVSLLGIVLVGAAGMSKERELPEEQKKKAVAEYSFKKGIMIAIFSGIMSAGMSFGLQGGPAIQKLAAEVSPSTALTWQGMPVLVVVLFGGFTVNALWCLFLNTKNRTFADYVRKDAPFLGNLALGAIAGAIWTCQFIAFKTGEPAMGSLSYVGWAVLMASQIMFSGILGLMLGEWKGTSGRTRRFLFSGLVLLLASAVIAGYSGFLAH